jgi:hypothetical protein
MNDPYHEWADRELMDEHEAHPERFAKYNMQEPNNRPQDGRICDCEDAPCCGCYEIQHN